MILKLLVPQIEKVRENRHQKDYKTLLQEFYQKQSKKCPRYELVKKTGPDHDQVFWVNVHLGEAVYGPAQGKSKKEAEQAAAHRAWEKIEAENSKQSDR